MHARKRYEHLSANDTAVAIYKAPDTAAVASFVVAAHRRLAANSPDRVASLAVLLRNPGAFVQLESRLALEGFHVETHGFEPYMQRPETQFLRVLVAWAADALDLLAHADLAAIQSALGEFSGFADHAKAAGVVHRTIATFAPYVFGSSATAFLEGADAHLRPPPLLYLSDATAIDAIRTKGSLDGLPDDDALMVCLVRESVGAHRVDSATFARAHARFGTTLLLNYVALIGNYLATAVMLTTFDQQLPAGATPGF